jgi:hypothetical protein
LELPGRLLRSETDCNEIPRRPEKNVEAEIETRVVAQIEPAVAAYAAAGQRFWRSPDTAPRVDTEVLLRLPTVRSELASFDGDLEADPHAGADAIDAAIKRAITSLPRPFAEAALEQFGLVYVDPVSTPYGKGDREERAAVHLGRTTQRWYDMPNKGYGGMKPREYVVALVAAALCDVPEPLAFLATRRADSLATPAADLDGAIEPHSPAARFGRRRRVLGATVAVLGIAVAAALLASHGSGGRAPSVPQLGSVVNAATGKVSPPGSLHGRPALSGGQIENGPILRACVLTAAGCKYPKGGQPTIAKVGDTLRFRLRVFDPNREGLSELKVSVWTSSVRNPNPVVVILEWPRGLANGTGIESIAPSTTIRFADGKSHGLRYVAGSSGLYAPSSHTSEGPSLARLPDGLFSSGGITLTEVGAPRGCWDCELAYVRYIDFSQQVT